MKKIIFFIVTCIFAFTSNVWAAGSCAQSVDLFKNTNFAVLNFYCKGDASNGSFPSTAISADTLSKIGGFYITEVRTYPGGTAPTDLYDIVINDAGGLDLMGGNLANRSTSSPQRAFPPTMASAVGDAFSLVITNNSVASALIYVKIYLGK